MSDQIDVNQAIKKINLFVSTLQDYQLPSGEKKKKKSLKDNYFIWNHWNWQTIPETCSVLIVYEIV